MEDQTWIWKQLKTELLHKHIQCWWQNTSEKLAASIMFHLSSFFHQRCTNWNNRFMVFSIFMQSQKLTLTNGKNWQLTTLIVKIKQWHLLVISLTGLVMGFLLSQICKDVDIYLVIQQFIQKILNCFKKQLTVEMKEFINSSYFSMKVAHCRFVRN